MDCVIKRISAFFISVTVLVYFIFCSTAMITDISADAISDMDELTKNYRNFCAVQICTMDGEELYSYNANSPVFCASVIKLPYAVFVCREIEAGKKSLDDTFTYTSSWYHKGTGVIRHNGEGKEYTVRQLLDYMLRYSDNVAYDVLVYFFGTEGFNSMIKEWGYSITLGTPSPRWPDITAEFARVSMEQMVRHSSDGEAWSVAWDALCNSEDVVSRSVLGKYGTDVAIKYGQVAYVYHEACYVDGDVPYILVIFTSTSDYDPDVDFIDEDFMLKAAGAADAIVNEHYNIKITPGDADADGQINSADLVYLWKYLMAKEYKTLPNWKNADLSQDGNVNILDYLILMKMLTA